MGIIPVFKCPACKGDVILQFYGHFLEWGCVECNRIWGIEVSKPVFALGGINHVSRRKD